MPSSEGQRALEVMEDLDVAGEPFDQVDHDRGWSFWSAFRLVLGAVLLFVLVEVYQS